MDNIYEKIQALDIPKLIGKNIKKKEIKDTENAVKGQIICITGAAGSIGFAILQKILELEPKKVIAVDISEIGIFKLETFIQITQQEKKVETMLCNITNQQDLERLFKTHKIDILIQAAAYKHVPIIEKNPIQGIYNNVLGTYFLVKKCEKYKVKKFLLISTDKAVNPTCMMGVTKRICEKLILAMKNSQNTIYMAVRFGNVVESSGSLTQIIKQQIIKQKPITITDKKMERYFMSIEEAVHFILLTLTFEESGTIYMFDMGQPINIYDLIVKILEQLQLKINEDVWIKEIGIRPGEKLQEELRYLSEKIEKTKFKKILKLEEKLSEKNSILLEFENIESIFQKEEISIEEINKSIQKIVPSYKREENNI